VIVVHETQSPIGTIGLSHIDREKGEAEYGIMLGEPEWRGQGLAQEASDLLLDYAFESLGLRMVRLNLFADNSSARTLYDRLGFVEGTSPSGEVLKDGVLRKTTAMYLTQPMWEKRRFSPPR
jgi:RimJ/RimL family protein N-acetyltransferase